VEMKDAVFGTVLDTRSFPAFAEGQYAVFTLKGHIQVRIINAAPHAQNSQTTLSGLFFGGKATGQP